jgi:hypothetical protein
LQEFVELAEIDRNYQEKVGQNSAQHQTHWKEFKTDHAFNKPHGICDLFIGRCWWMQENQIVLTMDFSRRGWRNFVIWKLWFGPAQTSMNIWFNTTQGAEINRLNMLWQAKVQRLIYWHQSTTRQLWWMKTLRSNIFHYHQWVHNTS